MAILTPESSAAFNVSHLSDDDLPDDDQDASSLLLIGENS